ncbi:MAG: sulfatase-like hydrolase/transferase, partial [Terriglobales bacterium]
SMKPPRSLVLITVDCFRADHAGFLGYPLPTTPFLDSLATESLTFSNAIVAGAPTYFSFPAVMASRPPLGLGRDVVGLAPGEPTIASALNEAGHATAAFLAANPYLSPRFGYDAGFSVFQDFLDSAAAPVPGVSDGAKNTRTLSRWNQRLAKASHALGPVGSIYDELYFRYCQRVASAPALSLDQLRRFPAADVIVDRARDWLTGIKGQPFFLWLHFMDPHSPYYPRREALEFMGQDSLDASRARYLNSYWNRGDLGASRLRRHRKDIVALYDAGIRWADAQVARLVDTLRGLGVWENCVMALTADHGEEFLDHGGRYHPPSSVSEELVRVPLLLRAPGLPRGSASAPFSLLHLAPTLLDLVGVSIPGSFRGRSHPALLDAGKGGEIDAVIECISICKNPFVVDDRLQARLLAVREARYKMVLDFNSATEQLYDLDADPAERRPLPPGAEKAVRRRLLDRARQHISDAVQSRDAEYRMAARLRDFRLSTSARMDEPHRPDLRLA